MLSHLRGWGKRNSFLPSARARELRRLRFSSRMRSRRRRSKKACPRRAEESARKGRFSSKRIQPEETGPDSRADGWPPIDFRARPIRRKRRRALGQKQGRIRSANPMCPGPFPRGLCLSVRPLHSSHEISSCLRIAASPRSQAGRRGEWMKRVWTRRDPFSIRFAPFCDPSTGWRILLHGRG